MKAEGHGKLQFLARLDRNFADRFSRRMFVKRPTTDPTVKRSPGWLCCTSQAKDMVSTSWPMIWTEGEALRNDWKSAAFTLGLDRDRVCWHVCICVCVCEGGRAASKYVPALVSWIGLITFGDSNQLRSARRFIVFDVRRASRRSGSAGVARWYRHAHTNTHGGKEFQHGLASIFCTGCSTSVQR